MITKYLISLLSVLVTGIICFIFPDGPLSLGIQSMLSISSVARTANYLISLLSILATCIVCFIIPADPLCLGIQNMLAIS